MQKYWNTVQDERGNPREGISVAVQQSGVNSTLYSTQVGAAKTNPLTTDSRGYFEFYAVAGEYDLVVSGTGFATYTILDGALVGMPSEDITFLPSGTGALTTKTVQDALRAIVRTGDFSSLANAQTAGAALTEQIFVNSLAVVSSSITANAGTSSIASRIAGTLVAGSNNSYQIGYYSNPVFATGAFTGLNAFGMLIDVGAFTKTGTGTISQAWGLFVDNPFPVGFATNTVSIAIGVPAAGNWALYSASTQASLFAGSFSVDNGVTLFSMGLAAINVTKPGVQLFSTGSGARVDFVDSAQSANNRINEFLWSGGVFRGRFLNDANSAATSWLDVTGGQASGTTSLVLTVGSGLLTLTTTGLAVTGVVDIIGTAVAATASHLQLGSTTQSTIGANGAASALTANPLGYLIAYLGTTKIVIPYYNA